MKYDRTRKYHATITKAICRGFYTYRVSQQSMSHLMSQDKGQLVNICHGLQHPRKHEHFPVLHKGKHSRTLSQTVFEEVETKKVDSSYEPVIALATWYLDT